MGIIQQSGHITDKKQLNHNGSPGDVIKILYTPNGGSEIVILEYQVDAGKIANMKFTLEEITGFI